MDFQHERVPRWILVVGAVGTPIAGIYAGPLGALGFFLGAAGSWWNYKHLQRVVKELAIAAAERKSPNGARLALGVFLRLLVVGGLAIVILTYTKVRPVAFLVGLFASCFAIILEILYENVWGNSTKSG
jgi:hypothetical protein